MRWYGLIQGLKQHIDEACLGHEPVDVKEYKKNIQQDWTQITTTEWTPSGSKNNVKILCFRDGHGRIQGLRTWHDTYDRVRAQGYYKDRDQLEPWDLEGVKIGLDGQYKEWQYKERYHKELQQGDVILYNHCFYKDGKIEGEYKTWYINTQLKQHYFYRDGKQEGEQQQYYPNERLHVHSLYEDDRRHGEEKTWDQNGVVQTQRFYYRGYSQAYYHGCPTLDKIPDDKRLANIPYHLTLKGMEEAWNRNRGQPILTIEQELAAAYQQIDSMQALIDNLEKLIALQNQENALLRSELLKRQ